MSVLIPLPSPARADVATATIERLIGLIDELLSVIADENQILSRGLPASLSPQTARKHELADQFERWVKDVAAHPVRIASCEAAMQAALTERITHLRVAMAENMDRLRAAMDATRRRIETVMQAIRDDMASAAPYGANGQVRDRRSRGSFCNLSIRA